MELFALPSESDLLRDREGWQTRLQQDEINVLEVQLIETAKPCWAVIL
jgi:hypothetical protein